MTEKAIIFDASTIITFAMNGMFPELRALKSIFKGKFLITKEVKREVIDRPIKTKRFELEAIKTKKLLEEKILEMPVAFNVDENEISNKTKELLDKANSTFKANGKNIHLIDSGETACLALSEILTKRNIKNVIAVDERTIRMLSEKPDNLKSIFQKKLKVKITPDSRNYKFFKGFKFIRSSELIYVAYKKGLVKLKGPMVLDALLYAVKFKGASISREEIEEIQKLG